jgi:hypothetical protein
MATHLGKVGLYSYCYTAIAIQLFCRLCNNIMEAIGKFYLFYGVMAVLNVPLELGSEIS